MVGAEFRRCGSPKKRIYGVRNSIVVKIVRTDLRGTELRSCTDFHGHGFSWHGIPSLCGFSRICGVRNSTVVRADVHGYGFLRHGIP